MKHRYLGPLGTVLWQELVMIMNGQAENEMILLETVIGLMKIEALISKQCWESLYKMTPRLSGYGEALKGGRIDHAVTASAYADLGDPDTYAASFLRILMLEIKQKILPVREFIGILDDAHEISLTEEFLYRYVLKDIIDTCYRIGREYVYLTQEEQGDYALRRIDVKKLMKETEFRPEMGAVVESGLTNVLSIEDSERIICQKIAGGQFVYEP